MSDRAFWLSVLAGFVLFCFAIGYGIHLGDLRDQRRCTAHHGHLVDLYKAELCVTSDGRIIPEWDN